MQERFTEIREAVEILGQVNPACSGTSSYWERYQLRTLYSSQHGWHNQHLTTHLDPDALAFFKLYGVEVLGVAEGRALVRKQFPVLSHRSEYALMAYNDGPLDAPLEFWQRVCQTLLDYAIQKGYEVPENDEQTKADGR